MESTIEKIFDGQYAQSLIAANELDKARSYAETWLINSDEDPEVLHFCGLFYSYLKEWPKALAYFKKAIEKNPAIATFHSNISNVYVALGDINLAKQHLHEALKLSPFHPETYNNLGRLYYKQGLLQTAIPLFEKSIRMNPRYWEAHYNLAHALAQENQFSRAKTHYEQVIKLNPEHPNAHFNLGLAAIECHDFELSVLHLQKAFELDPTNVEALHQLGNSYVSVGKISEAIHTFEQTLKVAPHLEDVQHNLAVLYCRVEERQKALQKFKEAHKINPTNETAKHMIQALSHDEPMLIEEAPKGYIRDLFNQYAEYYNTHVKTQLNYQVPNLLRNAVAKSFQSLPSAGRVLDLGCGTGLCGIYFRDLAQELIGIDLSPNMIEKAKKLEGYEALHVGDIIEFLENPDLESFDIIIAGDVFVYLGNLEKTFELVSKKLKSNGRFAFTIEEYKIKPSHTSHMSPCYYLQPSGRFAHSENYILELSQKFNFKILINDTIVPREHEGTPVMGKLFILTN